MDIERLLLRLNEVVGSQIPAAFDELSDPMVIALLGAGRGPHADDIGRLLTSPNSLGTI